MSSINRFIARIFSLIVAIALCAGMTARADAPLVASYDAQTIRFTHIASYGSGLAVGVEDPGLQSLLRAAGALMTWKPGERYVLITTSVPQVVSFAVGDRRYDVGPISLQASFAPYQQGDEVYLPLGELLGALDLALHQDASGAVLVPQLAALDVQGQGNRVAIVARGGAPLHPRVIEQSADRIVYEFDGVGTTLAGTRPVGAGGVRSLTIAQSGTAREPKTTVTVQLVAGATAEAPRTNDDRDAVLSFSGSGAMLPPPAAIAAATPPAQMPPGATPVPPSYAQAAQPPAYGEQAPAASAPAGPAQVTGVQVQPSADGSSVVVAISGNAPYEWHRLREPDNRFWIDVKSAQLAGAPLDETLPDPLISLRVRQVDPTTVRIALSLAGPKALEVSPSATGLTIDVGRTEVADAPRAGSGSVGTVVAVAEAAAPVTPVPSDEYGATQGPPADNGAWKFGPHSSYVPLNPRLIVIDPGHGGSDRGASRNGTDEADVALDISKRLRDLLVARGWQVKLTHDTDVDVYAPNDSAHVELQARDDVANNAGARLFVSIHCNSFINSGPYGTTLYISKAIDEPLAEAIERHTAQDGTKDDGIIKSHLYVTLHSTMPATLIETAFLSNPSDYSMLVSASWREKLAGEIADGIGDYTRSNPVPNQPSQ